MRDTNCRCRKCWCEIHMFNHICANCASGLHLFHPKGNVGKRKTEYLKNGRFHTKPLEINN